MSLKEALKNLDLKNAPSKIIEYGEVPKIPKFDASIRKSDKERPRGNFSVCKNRVPIFKGLTKSEGKKVEGNDEYK